MKRILACLWYSGFHAYWDKYDTENNESVHYVKIGHCLYIIIIIIIIIIIVVVVVIMSMKRRL
jgi:hypothetical protein